MRKPVAIGVTLGGNSKPVEITAFLRDDASILEYAQACTAVCVPGVDGLNTYNGALYSNGILGALKLRLSPLSEGEYTLESVVLNPCVALVWQPLQHDTLVCRAAFTPLCLAFSLARCAIRAAASLSQADYHSPDALYDAFFHMDFECYSAWLHPQ